jgi:hypothetical protein
MRLPPETIHLPFDPGPFRMAMGLVARDPDDLFEIDEHFPAELAERRALFAAQKDDVFAACPGSEAARAEMLARTADVLTRQYPDWFFRNENVLENKLTDERWNIVDPPCDPLAVAGLLAQEDLCLIDPNAPDGPRLIAGFLCFPSHWRLRDKIGLPLRSVHGPVPFYADRLAGPVDRLMRNLKPGRLAERLNWGLTDRAELRLESGHGRTAPNESVTAANAGEKLFLRVERQTLSVLPASGTVLFTIRVHRYALDRLVAPNTAENLAAAIRALPPDLARYKSLAPFRDAALGWLDARAAA